VFLIKIADFWGEGRIIKGNLITGFENSYNINFKDQRISNGINRGEVIPFLIPTESYEDVDVAKFIADDTFLYVTSMGAPIIPAAAKEMYRIIKKDDLSRIVLYNNKPDAVKEVQVASQDDFIYMSFSEQYTKNLDTELTTPTMRPINIIVPIAKVMQDLKESISNNDVESITNILKDLQVYCNAEYSQKNNITSQVEFLINHHMSSDTFEKIKNEVDALENNVRLTM
jgi:hypothetical protein